MIRAQPHIRRMSPYALADMLASAGIDLIVLSQNQSLRPPSPDALKAAADSLYHSADYPDPEWTNLHAALAHLHDIPADLILCGAGSLDMTGSLVRAFAGRETRYVDCVCRKLRQHNRTRIGRPEIWRLRAGLREDIILVIDEAYGVAGFRIGWRVFPENVAGEVRKVLNPNDVTLPSQAAALAGVKDQAYMQQTRQMTTAVRETALQAFIEAGFDVQSSLTNFLLIRFSGATSAVAAEAALREQGMFLRRQQRASLPHALRMTIGHMCARAWACL